MLTASGQNAKNPAFPPALLCKKWQFCPTKMQESIKARISNRMFHSKKITNSVRHFSLFLCPLFLSFPFPSPPFFLWSGSGATSQLIWGARGLPQNISCEEGGSSYTTGATHGIPPAPHPPLKVNGPQSTAKVSLPYFLF